MKIQASIVQHSDPWEEASVDMYTDDEEWDAIQRVPEIESLRSIMRIQLMDVPVWGMRTIVRPETGDYLIQQHKEEI